MRIKKQTDKRSFFSFGLAMIMKENKRKEKVLTGIDVIANPPGKKIKNINALSGGERTLTSIALICAILNYNPSPFVVLDEVEAALDEANTMRFTKIMQELSAQSQFIVISHNRVTMHAADALYGVVMKSDGISNMLSVKVEDVPQYEDVQKMRYIGNTPSFTLNEASRLGKLPMYDISQSPV